VADESDDAEIPGIERLLALTDGVVAIALTLLVLQLQVPATKVLDEHPESARLLWHALNPDIGELTSYLISFVIISQFWLVHHRVLRGMKGHSEGLAWRNFAFLLGLTLIPFTSDLIGRYGENPLALTTFALNLALLSLSTQWIYLYATKHNLISDVSRSAHDEQAARVRVILALLIVGLSIVLAWTAPNYARYTWALFLVMPATSAAISRKVYGTDNAESAGAGSPGRALGKRIG
jgi:uncharacterized membrane protein